MAYYASTDVEQDEPKDALLSLLVDSESGDILSETIYYAFDDEIGTYGELNAEPDGIIVPHPGRPVDLRLRWQLQRAEHAGRGAVGSLPGRGVLRRGRVGSGARRSGRGVRRHEGRHVACSPR